jgi:hypothetical protein
VGVVRGVEDVEGVECGVERVLRVLAVPDGESTAAGDGVAVTVTVAVTVGGGGCRSASRGSVRGGWTTTPMRSSEVKST